MSVDYPFAVDGRGRAATVNRRDHLRDLIEQVLMTSPGERVMRPDFGSGLQRLVFEPGGPETVATTQYLVQVERVASHLAVSIPSGIARDGRRRLQRHSDRQPTGRGTNLVTVRHHVDRT